MVMVITVRTHRGPFPRLSLWHWHPRLDAWRRMPDPGPAFMSINTFERRNDQGLYEIVGYDGVIATRLLDH